MRRLDRAALLAFVADVWAARGRETAVEDGVVIARDPATGARRRVGVAFGPGEAGDADAVVAPNPDRIRAGAGGDVRVIGPAEIRNLLRYALDRETAERLAGRHLDLSLSAPDPEPKPSVRTPRLLAALVAAATALALIAGGATVWSPGDPVTTATPATFDGGTPTPYPSGVGAYPVGVDRDGVENLTAFVERHRSLVAGQSYALSVSFDGARNADGTRVLDGRVAVRVRNGSVYRYRYTGVRFGDGMESGTGIDRAGYADGTALYVRDGDEYRRRPLPNDGEASPFADRVAELLWLYLSTEETSVRGVRHDSEIRYRIAAKGSPARLGDDGRSAPASDGPLGGDDLEPPFDRVRNYTAVAYVTPDGLVTDLRVSYERPDGTAVSFALSYASVGAATVEPPPWYPEARAATGGPHADEDGDGRYRIGGSALSGADELRDVR